MYNQQIFSNQTDMSATTSTKINKTKIYSNFAIITVVFAFLSFFNDFCSGEAWICLMPSGPGMSMFLVLAALITIVLFLIIDLSMVGLEQYWYYGAMRKIFFIIMIIAGYISALMAFGLYNRFVGNNSYFLEGSYGLYTIPSLIGMYLLFIILGIFASGHEYKKFFNDYIVILAKGSAINRIAMLFGFLMILVGVVSLPGLLDFIMGLLFPSTQYGFFVRYYIIYKYNPFIHYLPYAFIIVGVILLYYAKKRNKTVSN